MSWFGKIEHTNAQRKATRTWSTKREFGRQTEWENSSENDDGGFKATVTSGTVEVRFMTDPAKRSSFNLCMQ
jgi:hypothetical protein